MDLERFTIISDMNAQMGIDGNCSELGGRLVRLGCASKCLNNASTLHLSLSLSSLLANLNNLLVIPDLTHR